MSTRELIVVGISHRTTPLEVREALAVSSVLLPKELSNLTRQDELRDSVLLSTCNRTELYLGSDSPASTERAALVYFNDRLPTAGREHEVYVMRGSDSVRHLFRVAASLDSMVVGENQILGQVREAWEAADQHHALSTVLRRCFSHSLATGKRVRNETGIGHGNVSVASLACDLALKIFGDFDNRAALLLGAGEVGEQVAESLNKAGARIEICNRSIDRAVALASRYAARVVSTDSLDHALEHVDVLIASASADEHILDAEQIRRCMKARHGRPLFIVDIGVPRNVERSVGELDNVFVYDIDDLQSLTEANLAARKKEAKQAELIVGEEVETFEAWRRSLELTPTIVALQNYVHTIANDEFSRMVSRFPQLTEDQKSTMQEMIRRIANRILHTPLRQLKQARSDDADQLIASMNLLFELEFTIEQEIRQSVQRVAETSTLRAQGENSK